MAGKGSLWSTAEVECLLVIWADENIQSELDKTHKNFKIFKKVRDFLEQRGYRRTTEQCRDKIKKLRSQYVKVRASLRRRSSSSAAEKDKFPFYDTVDRIIGRKPSSQPNVLESNETSRGTTLDTWDIGHAASQNGATIHSNHGGVKQETAGPSTHPETVPPKQSRKRKSEVGEMLTAFMDMQKQHHQEFIKEEQNRYQQEKEMLDNWMKSQMELEERRLQMMREERRETNGVFMQTMNRLFDAMTPSSSHPLPPLSPHAHSNTPPSTTHHSSRPLLQDSVNEPTSYADHESSSNGYSQL